MDQEALGLLDGEALPSPRRRPALGEQNRGRRVRLDPPLAHAELQRLVEVVPVVVDRSCQTCQLH